MASLGEILRSQRTEQQRTISEVTAATHMKSEIVEALEHDDYRAIPAPIYGKGFVRLYAEYLGLDPEPLITIYMQGVTSAKRPSLRAEMGSFNAPHAEPAALEPVPEGTIPRKPRSESAALKWVRETLLPSLSELIANLQLRERYGRLCESGNLPRCIGITIGALIIVLLLMSTMSQCGKQRERNETAKTETEPRDQVTFSRLPPEPYLD